METAVYADREATVKEIVAPAGTRVETKDLLVVLDPV
jgi:pyruvate carboxylase